MVLSSTLFPICQRSNPCPLWSPDSTNHSRPVIRQCSVRIPHSSHRRYLEMIWIGMAGTCLGFGLFIKLGLDSSLAEIVLFQIIVGIGVGLVFQPPLIALQSLVKHDDVAAATALLGFVRSLSTAVSVIIGGVVVQNQMQAHYKQLLLALPLDIAQKFTGNDALANVKLVGALTGTQKMKVQQSYGESLSSMWILYVSVAALGLVLSTIISKQHLSTEHIETKTGLGTREAHSI